MDQATRRPRRRSVLDWTRIIVEVALLVVIAVGLGGVVLGRLVPALGHPVFVVAGPSMEPAIGIGAAVVLDPVDPATLAVGDVVSLRSGPDKAVFTHRILRTAERDGTVWFETRGDANASPDPSLTPASAVIGRVTVVLPGAGYLLTLLSAPAGVALILSVGATLIVLGWYLETLQLDRRRREVATTVPATAIASITAVAATSSASPAMGVTSDVHVVDPGIVAAPAVPARSPTRSRKAVRRAARPSVDTMASERRRLTRARATGRGS